MRKACDVCGSGCRPTNKKWLRARKRIIPVLGMFMLILGMAACASEKRSLPPDESCEKEVRDLKETLSQCQDLLIEDDRECYYALE